MNVSAQEKMVIGAILAAALLLLLLLVSSLFLGATSPRQQAERFVISLPVLNFPPTPHLVDGFLEKMHELGYREGDTVVYRRHDLVSPNPQGIAHAATIIQQQIVDDVDILLVTGNPEVEIALQETAAAGKPIPIVAVDMFDPIEKGFAQSYRSSETNLTGIAEERSHVAGKLLEFLLEIDPNIRTLGVLTDGFIIPSDAAPGTEYLQTLHEQSNMFGIELVEYTTGTPPGSELQEALENTLNGIGETEVDAWTHIPGHFLPTQQVDEHEMTLRAKIPFGLLATLETDPETGDIVGLFAYGANFKEKGAEGAVLADKILRGTAPAELPIEFPKKYDLIVNQKTAREIGVSIPSFVLELADSIVE